jgi:predicted ester cyclase
LEWNEHRHLLTSVYYTAFPDMQLHIEEMIAGGNQVVARVICTDTHKDDFQGMTPTGKKIPFGALWIQDIDEDDGKLAEEWIAVDAIALM